MVYLANCRQELPTKVQDQMFKTKTKTSWSKTTTKTFIFVGAPRDQDPGLQDYITEVMIVTVAICHSQ